MRATSSQLGAVSCSSRRTVAESPTQRGIEGESDDRVGERSRIAFGVRGARSARPATTSAQAAYAARDHGLARRLRLERDVPETFREAGLVLDRRNGDDIGGCVVRRDFVADPPLRRT